MKDSITVPDIEIGPDLRLRLLKESDASDVFNYSSDPEFCRHLKANPPESIQQSMDFINWILTEIEQGKRCYWGIEFQGVISGTIGLLNFDNHSLSAEIGFGISRELWGKGIINQCLHAIIDYAANTLCLTKLLIGTDKNNVRAIEFAKKSGFTFNKEENGKVYFVKDIQDIN